MDETQWVQLLVHVPKELHRRIKQRALDEDTTIRKIAAAALEAYLAPETGSRLQGADD